MEQSHEGIGDNIIVEGDYINTIQKYPTLLGDIINTLGSKLFDDDFIELGFSEFDIKEKIEYNDLSEYREVIEEYKIFQGKINSIYSEIEALGSNKKRILLRTIRDHYLEVKWEFVNANPDIEVINVIRTNSDAIFHQIENRLLKQMTSCSTIEHTLEVIKIGIRVVIVDAFMRCKILEPKI